MYFLLLITIAHPSLCLAVVYFLLFDFIAYTSLCLAVYILLFDIIAYTSLCIAVYFLLLGIIAYNLERGSSLWGPTFEEANLRYVFRALCFWPNFSSVLIHTCLEYSQHGVAYLFCDALLVESKFIQVLLVGINMKTLPPVI